jgi:hypothetical protein
VILILGWLLPGAGHFVLGQRWRGVAFFVLLTATFALGLVLTEGGAVSFEEHRIALCAQIFAGAPALAGLVRDHGRYAAVEGFSIRPIMSPEVVAMIDLGLLFTMLAGLLNLLLIVDAYERALAARRRGS